MDLPIHSKKKSTQGTLCPQKGDLFFSFPDGIQNWEWQGLGSWHNFMLSEK